MFGTLERECRKILDVDFFFIGILGEYIGAIHSQVRKRPMVIERERINFDRAASQSGRTSPQRLDPQASPSEAHRKAS